MRVGGVAVAANLNTLFLFAGFSVWAVFLGALADRLDKGQER